MAFFCCRQCGFKLLVLRHTDFCRTKPSTRIPDKGGPTVTFDSAIRCVEVFIVALVLKETFSSFSLLREIRRNAVRKWQTLLDESYPIQNPPLCLWERQKSLSRSVVSDVQRHLQQQTSCWQKHCQSSWRLLTMFQLLCFPIALPLCVPLSFSLLKNFLVSWWHLPSPLFMILQSCHWQSDQQQSQCWLSNSHAGSSDCLSNCLSEQSDGIPISDDWWDRVGMWTASS